jgi:NDP-sugar pyrophosphorylase family protein
MTLRINGDLTVVILAGPGRRMYPLISSGSADSESLHKCLLPIGNRPMILHLLNNLAAAGCSSVIIVTAPRTVSRLSTVVRSAHHAMDISIISDESCNADDDGETETDVDEESSPLLALLRCKDLIRRDFCVLPADIYVSSSALFVQLFNQLADVFRANNASMATLLLSSAQLDGDEHDRVLATFNCQPDRDDDTCAQLLSLRGLADLEEEAICTKLSLLRKFPRLKFASNCFDLCWYIFSHEVMDMVCQLYQETKLDDGMDFWSIREDLIPRVLKLPRPSFVKIAALHDKDTVLMRVATVRALGDVNKQMAVSFPSAGKADVILAESCKLGDKTLIKRSVIGSHVSIGAGSKLVNCVLMDGASIGPNCKVDNSVIGPKAMIHEKATLKDCWLAPMAVVSAESNLKGESVVSAGSRHFDDLFQ